MFAVAYGQSARGPRTAYYLFVSRAGCCELDADAWARIDRTLRTNGIPTFWGIYTINDYGIWYPSTVQKTIKEEGELAIGPFASAGLADAALRRLLSLLPRDSEYRSDLHTLDGRQQWWSIDMYQIRGVSSSTPLTVKPPKVKEPGTIEGVVIDTEMGMKWISIIVRGDDGNRYMAQLGGQGAPDKVTGMVNKVGNRVRITFKDKEPPDSQGVIDLHATSIIQIKR
jgi:hypothetical protein